MIFKIVRIFVGLLIVGTIGAVVIFALGIDMPGQEGTSNEEPQAPQRVIPPSPVVAKEITLEPVEIIDSYSGMIRPKERFTLGFEIPGRVTSLAAKTEAADWDVGGRVARGDVLAQLDARVLVARLQETVAELERVQADYDRNEELRLRQPGALSDSEFSQIVATRKLAQARFDMAEKNLEDATLVSPTDGVISKRLVNVGESVNPHQPVFELLELDEVLLVVGVPESFVGEIHPEQPVHVELFARDRFGRKRTGTEGQVRRVAEAADDTTGLFEVEVLVANQDGRFKPGQIAMARVVVDHIQAFRVPLTSAVFREDRTLLFSAGDDNKAHAFVLEHWIEQGSHLILSELPPEHRRIVVRGQHRLVDGRAIKQVDLAGNMPDERATNTSIRTAANEP